jgi:hypothetical protein
MDQIKLIGELANDVSNGNTDVQTQAPHGANEIRTLNDLEMVITGGGDGLVCW